MTLSALLARLQGRAAARGERALLVVRMVPDVAPHAPWRRANGAPADRADRLAARLGTENERLLHDARDGPDAAALAAEIGTVPLGGALLLLVAPPDVSGSMRSATRFGRHLQTLLGRMPETGAIVALPPAALPRLRALCDERVAAAPSSGAAAAASRADGIAAQDEQLHRLRAQLAGGERRVAAVVAAARGRGKSALLGRLAAALEREGVPYTVTAAHRAATEVLERHRLSALAVAGAEPEPLPFAAPDAACANGGDVLLIDEAASLPLPLLETLLGRYSRVVLASTSEGHESAGRAFALRLPAMLERLRPGAWSTLAPSVPLRWRAGDPLDAFVARALLPPPRLVPIRPAGSPPAAGAAGPVAEVDRNALIDDERRLAALFGLLAATHYQSSPLDLTHLLDSPALRIWAVERDDAVLGVALVAVERGLPRALHADVLAGRRRPPHALLPQLLARCADSDAALSAAFARVTRIAVHPDARRRGIGSALIDAVSRDTAGAVEALGASFGTGAATLAFWRANGFTPFHTGFRRNPRSGVPSTAVLRANSARVATVLAEAVAIHRDNERPASDVAASASRRDARLLRRFAEGGRSVHDTRAALRRLVERCGPDVGDAGGDGAAAEADLTAQGHRPGREAAAAATDEATRLLEALRVAVPPSRRERERRLRDAVRQRLGP